MFLLREGDASGHEVETPMATVGRWKITAQHALRVWQSVRVQHLIAHGPPRVQAPRPTNPKLAAECDCLHVDRCLARISM
jgi:hypothetical protein